MGLWKKGFTSLIPPQGQLWCTNIASFGLGIFSTAIYYSIQKPQPWQSPQIVRLPAQSTGTIAHSNGSSTSHLSPGCFW